MLYKDKYLNIFLFISRDFITYKLICCLLIFNLNILGCSSPTEKQKTSPTYSTSTKETSNPPSQVNEPSVNIQESKTVVTDLPTSIDNPTHSSITRVITTECLEITYDTHPNSKIYEVQFIENDGINTLESDTKRYIEKIAIDIDIASQKYNLPTNFLFNGLLSIKKISDGSFEKKSLGFSIFTGIISAVTGLPIPEKLFMAGCIQNSFNTSKIDINSVRDTFNKAVQQNGTYLCLPFDNLADIMSVLSSKLTEMVEEKSEGSHIAQDLLNSLEKAEQEMISKENENNQPISTILELFKDLKQVFLPNIHLISNTEELYETVFNKQIH